MHVVVDDGDPLDAESPGVGCSNRRRCCRGRIPLLDRARRDGQAAAPARAPAGETPPVRVPRLRSPHQRPAGQFRMSRAMYRCHDPRPQKCLRFRQYAADIHHHAREPVARVTPPAATRRRRRDCPAIHSRSGPSPRPAQRILDARVVADGRRTVRLRQQRGTFEEPLVSTVTSIPIELARLERIRDI